ncbi:MAG: hypothetical protein ACR2FO_00260 [Actinomycetota bacterium]
MADFQPGKLFEVLSRHRVKYVLIGGVAAASQGSPDITQDTDICYARDEENLKRLAEALVEIEAELRGAPSGLPFKLDAKRLRMGGSFTFTSTAGDVDCIGTPAGTSGYEDLARSADVVTYRNSEIQVASIPDLIRMKKAAGRSKDLRHLETLSALEEEREKPKPKPGRGGG